MMGRRPALLLAALALSALAASACGKVFEYPVTAPENDAERCADGLDNDLDGAADCYDPECASFCTEHDAVTCADGADNDLDGQLDCRDPDCAEFCREGSRASCQDGVDNDLDGQLDCRDPDCAQYCQETGDALCHNDQDDDADGLKDCDDPDCDGNCPEESDEACADGRDNDGDTLVDGADPRCWLRTAPHVERCSLPELDWSERFDDAFFAPGEPPELERGLFDARWSVSGQYLDQAGKLRSGVMAVAHRDVPTGPSTSGGRNDLAAAFVVAGKMLSQRMVAGTWDDLVLSFSTHLAPGSEVEVAVIPREAAADYDASASARSVAGLAVRLDATASPTLTLTVGGDSVSKSFALPPFEACGDYACDNGWLVVKVAYRDGALQATAEGVGVDLELASAPLHTLELPESQLVLSGSSVSEDRSAALDDLRVQIHSQPPCGLESAPIPGGTCGYPQRMGDDVSFARDASGQYCALVSAQGDDGNQTLTAWTSSDGAHWTPAAPVGSGPKLPEGTALLNVDMTFDGTDFLAGVLLADLKQSHLALARARRCSDFGELTLGPEVPRAALGAGYLVSEGRHEVYFTRPPSADTGTTLWRLSGPSELELELEPDPVAELPLGGQVVPPVSISRVGRDDLVMIYPTRPDKAVSGLGVMVGSPDARSWQPLPQLPFLPSQAQSFDGDGPPSAALAFDGAQGVILYGGKADGTVTVGLARLWPSDGEPPPPFVEPCGDGACSSDESCRTCPADCSCPGKVVAEGKFENGGQGWLTSANSGSRPPYFDAANAELMLQSENAGWAELPLDKAIVGDFELELDLTIPHSHGPPGTHAPVLDSMYLGLGQAPASGVGRPTGVFARITDLAIAHQDAGACFDHATGYVLSPLVATASGSQSTLKFAAKECPADALLVESYDEKRHLLLSRKGGTVSVSASGADGCAESVSLERHLPLPDLTSIVLGTYNTEANDSVTEAELSNLVLRLPDDPNECPRGSNLCAAKGSESSCVDTGDTPEHCGGCGAACQVGATCSHGACQCEKGRLDCPDECADPQTSADNCGACGTKCAAYCLAGECDAGQSCAQPKVLAAGPGSYSFDFAQAPAASTWCGFTDLVTRNYVFQWTPTRTGRASFALDGADYRVDTLLAVTPDPSCELYDVSGCNDDASFRGGGSRVALDVELGVPYYVSVLPFPDGQIGRATLTIEEP